MKCTRHDSLFVAMGIVAVLGTGCGAGGSGLADTATDTGVDGTGDGTVDPDAMDSPDAPDGTDVIDVPTEDVVYEPPTGTWVVSVGGWEFDEASAALATPTGGALIAGKAYVTHMDHPDILPLWLGEIGTDGAVAWQVLLGIYDEDRVNSMAPTPDGGVLLAGAASVIEEAEAIYIYDAMLIRVDGAGDVQWARTVGEDGDDSLDAVIPTTDGAYVTVGWTTEYVGGASSGWMAKVDPDGAILWQEYVQESGHDQLHGVVETTGGDLLVVGETDSGAVGGTDLLVLRTTTDGAVVWQKILGGTGDERGLAIAATADGGLVAVGSTRSAGPGWWNALIVRMDGDGAVSWQRVLGGDGNDTASAVLEHTDGSLLVAGDTSPSLDAQTWLIGLSATGDVISQTSLGVAGYGDTGTMLAGYDGTHVVHVASTSSNAGDILVSRTGREGAVEGCSLHASTTAATVDPGWTVQDGTLTIAGSYLATASETVHTWTSDLPAARLCPE
ncbi:MAG: hypothetical protein JRG91_19315 [Deltaproteobacteria bacterium]|nr:hypothetical protein [Deltaproteobacteria bacterium]